jgi:hypothetical protein
MMIFRVPVVIILLMLINPSGNAKAGRSDTFTTNTSPATAARFAKMKVMGRQRLFLVIAALAISTLFLGHLFGSTPAIAQAAGSTDNATATVGLTSDMLAANGPLPGNLSLYATEVACSAAQNTTGYYSSLNGAEVADAQRSELYPCAHFTGSFTDPSQNVVYAWKSQDNYQGTSFVNNRNPGELYLTGGDFPNLTGSVAPGPYVAKVDATTGAQNWRTYLDNANTNNDWIGTNNLNILPNGNILFAFARQVVLLDGNTGLILKHNNLPAGPAGNDASFKHVTIAPDGTAIIKDQTRPGPGCSYQGTSAIFACKGTQPNSTINAVDPNTLQILDSITMPDESTTPHTITMHDGKIAIYISGNKAMYRYFWDPGTRKLSQDTSWVVSDYLQPGQTTGDAPGILGDFVVVQTNGLPTNVSSTVVSISQSNPKNLHSVTPFGPLKQGQKSFAPPKSAVDVDNNFVISADQGVNGLAGIKVEPNTGNLTVVWTVKDGTYGFQTIIGPKDQRVLVVSNINPNATAEQMKAGTYTEQVLWRNMLTGKALAQSNFTEAMTAGSLITPAYGGRVYFVTDNGFIVYYVTTHHSANSTTT